ncbi:hypothetical protein L3Q82_018543, partial [Scortum barcoo]
FYFVADAEVASLIVVSLAAAWLPEETESIIRDLQQLDRHIWTGTDRRPAGPGHPSSASPLQAGAVLRAVPVSMGDGMADETRVIYHLEDQETPYLIRINVPAERVTLADFKQVLNKPNVKFFFKSVDDDFGVVKEEISDDDAKLPFVNGRVVCWLVSSETCQSDFRGSDVLSVATPTYLAPPPVERTGGIGDSRPPSFHAAAVSGQDELQGSEVRSVASPPQRREREDDGERGGRLNGHAHQPAEQNGAGPTSGGDSSSTQQSSQLETTSFCSSEEDSGGSSVTDSTMSLNVITVTLNMGEYQQRNDSIFHPTLRLRMWGDLVSVGRGGCSGDGFSRDVEVDVTGDLEGNGNPQDERYNFLGISIVGQSNDRGDGGIYIGSIMKGGAVAADGRIEPGDMLLQVNEINFENMSNDDAVRVLREIVHKPGPVTLTVAKCWDPNPRGCFTLPRSEPVRPIDPAAWVSHTAAMTGRLLPHYSVHEENHLTIHSDITAVVKAMANPESGLEVRDRMWLKITIPNAFIGSDVVDWLHHNVEGFTDRREARKYAGNLLKAGYIRHTVNKVTFSEQCYYVFGDLCGDLGVMSLLDHEDSYSRGGGSDCDSLAPASGLQRPPAFPYEYPVPHPYSSPHQLHHLPAWGGGRGGGSQHSEGSHSSGSNCSDGQKEGQGGSEPEPTKQEVSASPDKQLLSESPGNSSALQPPTSFSGIHGNKDSKELPPAPSPSQGQRHDVSASRQSFCLAMGNTSDFFVDVM